MPPMISGGQGPDDHVPIIMRGGEGSAAKSANERMTGTGRETEIPGEHIPEDSAEQGADQDLRGDDAGVNEAGGNGFGNGRARQGASEIGGDGEHDGHARGERFGGNNRGDAIGGVVQPVDLFKDERDENDCEDQCH